MMRNVQQYWIFALLVSSFLLAAPQLVAQEVYFAEDPPMTLDRKITEISNLIVEYSAKNNGLIQLELMQDSQTVVGKGTFTVRRRGSNTATMKVRILFPEQALAPGTNYEYRLTLFENKTVGKKSATKRTNHTGFTTSLVPSSVNATPELKKVGKTTIVTGVKVL